MPFTGWGKTFSAITMFVALLVVAFPITILSINMSELYNNYRTEKVVEQQEGDLVKADRRKSIARTTLTEDQVLLLKEMSQDLVKSIENLTKLQEAATSVLAQNAAIRVSVKAMMGEFESTIINKRRSVAIAVQ